MSSAETPVSIPDLQQSLASIEQIGQAAATPFIKSDAGKATEQKVVAVVNLGVAALPLFAQLFQTIANLFHHAHKQATAPVAPPANPSASDQ